jgi:hypothetical protein
VDATKQGEGARRSDEKDNRLVYGGVEIYRVIGIVCFYSNKGGSVAITFLLQKKQKIALKQLAICYR